MDTEKLTKIHGECLELITPSGMEVVIRQQTGDDDDILSNGLLSKDGSSAAKFIAGIVVHSSIGALDINAVLNMRLADKYYIIIASRIFSIGQIVKFTYDWADGRPAIPYEEDLADFIWEYAEPFPEVGTPEYNESRLKPISSELTRELTLETGKLIRYTFMNGYGEKYLMTLPINEQSKNQELLARKIQVDTSTGFTEVQNFKSFTPREMMEIRNDVEKHDPVVTLLSMLTHPTTGEIAYLPIIGTEDFFYPREI